MPVTIPGTSFGTTPPQTGNIRPQACDGENLPGSCPPASIGRGTWVARVTNCYYLPHGEPRGSQSPSLAASARINSQTRSTCAWVVPWLPIARRRVKRPCSLVPEMKTSPVSLTALLDAAVLVVGALVAEADGRERRGRGALEARVGVDLGASACAMRTCSRISLGHSFAAVDAHHEPQLERAEAAAERQRRNPSG